MKVKFIDYMPYRNFAKQGWYMWVYPDDTNEFLAWIHEHMTDEYSAIPRFNSGSPMVETFITGDADYVKFKLVWAGKY
jgi:hypothetical protein